MNLSEKMVTFDTTTTTTTTVTSPDWLAIILTKKLRMKEQEGEA